MQKRRITIQHVSVMHIFNRMSWNIQWNLHTYEISNLQSTTSHMSNVVENRGTTRFITKPRMDIYVKSSHLITEQLNQLSIVNIFLSSCIDLSKGIRHIQKTGKVHKRRPARSAYADEASPVKWSNRPGHQRSSGQPAYAGLANEVVPRRVL